MTHGSEHIDPFFKAFQDAFENFEAEVPEAEMQADWDQISHQVGTAMPKVTPKGLKGLSLKTIGVISAGIAIVGTAVLLGVSALKEPAGNTETGKDLIQTEQVEAKGEDGNIVMSGSGKTDNIQAQNGILPESEGENRISGSKEHTVSSMKNEVAGEMSPAPAVRLSDIFLGVYFSDTMLCIGDQLIVRNTYDKNSPVVLTLVFPDKEVKNFKGSVSYTFTKEGTYKIWIKTENKGQVLTKQQNIYVFALPLVDFIVDESDMPTIHFTNRSKNATTFKWIFGEDQSSEKTNPSWTFITSGTYNIRLVASNRYGCQDEMSRSINIVVGEGQFKEPYIPNIFSPNGDGVNDQYFITIENDILYQLNILDRYGDLVFSSVSKDEKWDGKNKSNGKECLEGSYFYVFKYQLQGQVEAVKKTGTIYLEK